MQQVARNCFALKRTGLILTGVNLLCKVTKVGLNTKDKLHCLFYHMGYFYFNTIQGDIKYINKYLEVYLEKL